MLTQVGSMASTTPFRGLKTAGGKTPRRCINLTHYPPKGLSTGEGSTQSYPGSVLLQKPAQVSRQHSLVLLPGAARGIRALRGGVELRRIDEIILTVPIMVANPCHRKGQAAFVAALWRQVEKVVRAHQNIKPARVSGIGVKDFASLVLAEYTGSRRFLAGQSTQVFVVVVHLSLGHIVLHERYSRS